MLNKYYYSPVTLACFLGKLQHWNIARINCLQNWESVHH